MSPYFRIAAAMASLAVAASPAAAQGAAASAAAAGSAAKGNDAPGAGRYRSAFAGFRAFAEQPVGSWRQANEVVSDVGGWRAYAREAQGIGAPDSAAAHGAGGHGGMALQPVGRAAAVQPAASSPGVVAVPGARGHAGHKAP